MTQQEQLVQEPPVEVGYVLRIIHPATTSHTAETHTYPAPTDAALAASEVMEKLHGCGVEEFEIHIINQSTGAVVQRHRSVVERKVVYEVS